MGFRKRQFEFGLEELPEDPFSDDGQAITPDPVSQHGLSSVAGDDLVETEELDGPGLAGAAPDLAAEPDGAGALSSADEDDCADGQRDDSSEPNGLRGADRFAWRARAPIPTALAEAAPAPSRAPGPRTARSRWPSDHAREGRLQRLRDRTHGGASLAVALVVAVAVFAAWSALTGRETAPRERAQTPPGRLPVERPTIDEPPPKRPRRAARSAHPAPRAPMPPPVREPAAAPAPDRAPVSPSAATPVDVPAAGSPPTPAPVGVPAPPAPVASSAAPAEEEFGFER